MTHLRRKTPRKAPKMTEWDRQAAAHSLMLRYLGGGVGEFGTDYGTIHAIDYKKYGVDEDALFACWVDGRWLEHFAGYYGDTDVLDEALDEIDCYQQQSASGPGRVEVLWRG